MRRYIGLDVHAASTTMAVVGESGKLLRRLVVETNGRALIEAIRMIAGHKHLCFEEGTQSAWLYEILEPHVHELVVMGVTKSRGPKSDAHDAHGLAEQLRIGAIEKYVYKAPRRFTMLRDLARVHMMVTRDLVRVQSRLKAVYRSRGVPTPGSPVYHEATRDEWLSKLPASPRKLAYRLYEQYDFLVELKEQAEIDLKQESRKHRITRVLETCPGLGPIRVARLLPVVVTPHRFRTKKQFWSYCGLGIVMRSSSDWVRAADGGWIRAKVHQTRGLNRQHNHGLKDIFKGAATTVINKRSDDPMRTHYQRMLQAGTKPNLAKVTLARKIAATALRMWKNEETYKPDKYQKSSTTERNA
jgi:transposase